LPNGLEVKETQRGFRQATAPALQGSLRRVFIFLADALLNSHTLCSKTGGRPVDWQASELIQFISVAELRKAFNAKRVIVAKPKGAQEGFELRVTWPSVVARSHGTVSAVSESRIQFKRSASARTISLGLSRGDITLLPLVAVGEQIDAGQIIASWVYDLEEF